MVLDVSVGKTWYEDRSWTFLALNVCNRLNGCFW